MEITILIDQDILGFDMFIEEGLKETGWDQLIQFQFKRLRDFDLPANLPDQEVWRFVQAAQFLLVTSNRNSEEEISLNATIWRENTLESLPVVTVSHKESLIQPDYRQRVATSIAGIVLDLDNFRGTGRIFVPA